MKIVCVRIGDRYGPEYEEYLESKLLEHEFVWIRKEVQPNVKLQWNKMFAMTIDTDEPIVVMDIDVLLLNDYKQLFDYPIKRGQVLTIPGWWRDEERYTINGGFFKYYPKDVQYILEKFLKQPEYWQRKYIEEGWTSGPINGEQHFMEDSIKEKLEMISVPKSWVTRVDARKKNTHDLMVALNREYQKQTGNSYMFMGNKFHPDIKLVHFTNMDNHPKDWDKYELFK